MMEVKRPSVLCLADLATAPEALAILRSAADINCVRLDQQQLLAGIQQYDAIWVDLDTKLDREILDRATRLRVVNTASTGTDHIDKEFLAKRGIRLLCIKDDFGLLNRFTATAECAWMLLLACARRLRECLDTALADSWQGRRALCGRQLSNMTLGILGVGRLGRMTAEYAKAFRMRVLGCDLKEFQVPGVERVSFDTLLRESDAVSVHIHLTPENHQLFDAGVFADMKSGAILVNTSRGDIVDEAALLAALETGRLAAYGTDVIHDEWRADMSASPLVQYARKHRNVVITPHIGGNTDFSVREARLFSARKLAHYLKTGEELAMP